MVVGTEVAGHTVSSDRKWGAERKWDWAIKSQPPIFSRKHPPTPKQASPEEDQVLKCEPGGGGIEATTGREEEGRVKDGLISSHRFLSTTTTGPMESRHTRTTPTAGC